MASAEVYSAFSNINFDTEIPVAQHLGRGSVGEVFGPCLWKNSLFAFKRILIPVPCDSNVRSTWEATVFQIMVNLRKLSFLDHRNLVKIWYVDFLPLPIYIVMEYASGGTLRNALRLQSSLLPYSIVIDWVEQIATGMSYLHERSIIHGNLKSSNIMILERFDPNCFHDTTLKITDFHQMHDCNRLTTGDHSSLAPEVIRDGNLSQASDIWSYGMVLWEILTKETPYEVGKVNLKLTNLDSCFKVLLKLFEGCCEQIQENRPAFPQILGPLQIMRQEKEVIEILLAERNTVNYERMLPKGLLAESSSELKDDDGPYTVEGKCEIKSKRIPKQVGDRGVVEMAECNTENYERLKPEGLVTASGGELEDNVQRKVEETPKVNWKPIQKPEEDRQPGSVDDQMRCKQQQEGDEDVRVKLLKQTQPTIYGLSVLKNEVFVSHLQSSVIVVYDSSTFSCKRKLTVSGLTNPEHIVSCKVYECLYALDWSYRKASCEILRIDPHIGKVVRNWKTLDGGGRLSVASDTNIILNVNSGAQLNEYTADGELLRRINLASGTCILQAWHALKLDSGLFVVCHGEYGDPKSRVCLMSIVENHSSFDSRFDAEVLMAFGDECGDLLKCPMYLAVDKDGSILVCDGGTRRLLVLNSGLDEPRQLVPDGNDITILPWRICVDEINDGYLIADYHSITSCKVLSDGRLDWQTVLG